MQVARMAKTNLTEQYLQDCVCAQQNTVVVNVNIEDVPSIDNLLQQKKQQRSSDDVDDDEPQVLSCIGVLRSF